MIALELRKRGSSARQGWNVDRERYQHDQQVRRRTDSLAHLVYEQSAGRIIVVVMFWSLGIQSFSLDLH